MFNLDLSKKITNLRNFIMAKLQELETGGGRALAGEALKVSLKKEMDNFSRWTTAQIVTYR
jgi:hypothetical protein